eukprot:3316840-Pleurochrysis_carterae.AAC.2
MHKDDHGARDSGHNVRANMLRRRWHSRDSDSPLPAPGYRRADLRKPEQLLALRRRRGPLQRLGELLARLGHVALVEEHAAVRVEPKRRVVGRRAVRAQKTLQTQRSCLAELAAHSQRLGTQRLHHAVVPAHGALAALTAPPHVTQTS